MKNVPFYFYINTKIDEPSAKQKRLLKAFFEWMGRVSFNSNSFISDSHFYQEGRGEFLGFVKEPVGQCNNTFGARFDFNEDVFKQSKAKKITLEYWNDNIRNKKYKAITTIRDTWNDMPDSDGNICGENIQVKSLKRNDIVQMPTRATSITKALKEKGLDPKKFKGSYIIEANWATRNSNYGFFLTGEEQRMINHDWHPLFDIKRRIKGLDEEVMKCGYTGHYASNTYTEQAEAINNDGNTVTILTAYCSPTKSTLHELAFTSSVAAENYGFVRCPVQSDWVKPEEVREEPNAGYHKLSREFMCPSNTNFTIGFEIEKEDLNARNDIGYKSLFERTKWCKERDGSLDGATGYELISPVYNLFSKELDNDINKDKDLTQLINAQYSDNCGGHINIGSNTFSPIQLLFGIKGFLPLLYSIWSVRVDNRYSQVKKAHEYDSSKNAIKVKKHVIEIRLATAVKSVKNMLWRRDLVRIMMKNINKSESEVLRMMLNPRSILHKHLRKVYNAERFMKKCNDFVKYSEDYNNIKLEDVDWDAIDAAKAESTPVIEED